MKPANDPAVDYRALVREGYDRCAARYEALRREEVEPDLRRLIVQLEAGTKVLDVGCGVGIPIAMSLAQHFEVTGVDISAEMVRRARENLPDATFIHADVLEVELPVSNFDAVVSFYALFHLPREQHDTLLRRIHRWLKPGGYLLITVASENEAPYTEGFLGVTMYWSNYGLQEYETLLKEIGFELIEVTTVGHGYKPTHDTREESHPLIFARKAEDNA